MPRKKLTLETEVEKTLVNVPGADSEDEDVIANIPADEFEDEEDDEEDFEEVEEQEPDTEEEDAEEEDDEEAKEAPAAPKKRTRTRTRRTTARHTGREITLPDELKQEGKVGINTASKKERRKLYQDSDKVWAIDPDAPASTEKTELYETYKDIVSSYQTGKILTGTITSVGVLKGTNVPCAFVDYNDYTIIIPAEHLYVNATQDKSGEKLEVQSIAYYLDKRIGSDVSFIILQVFESEKEAFASAIAASEKLVDRYFLDTDSRGKHRINEGDLVEGQITFVMARGIGVNVQGVEAYVTRSELSYLHVSNPLVEVDQTGRQKYYVGKKINVKVKKIRKMDYKLHHTYNTENRTIQKDSVFHLVDLDISVKEAQANPMVETFGKPGFRVGDKVQGRILDRNEKGYFVRIKEKRDILCDDDLERLPIGAIVKVKIRRVNPKDYNIYGKITEVIRMPQ